MNPTYSDLSHLQDAHSQYRYDHSDTTPQELTDAETLLVSAITEQEQLTARAYGEYVGAWYWSNQLHEWITPPRKVWVNV